MGKKRIAVRSDMVRTSNIFSLTKKTSTIQLFKCCVEIMVIQWRCLAVFYTSMTRKQPQEISLILFDLKKEHNLEVMEKTDLIVRIHKFYFFFPFIWKERCQLSRKQFDEFSLAYLPWVLSCCFRTESLSLWLSSKDSACNAGDTGDAGSTPVSLRCPGEGNCNPLQYSCLEDPMDRRVWWSAVHNTLSWNTEV